MKCLSDSSVMDCATKGIPDSDFDFVFNTKSELSVRLGGKNDSPFQDKRIAISVILLLGMPIKQICLNEAGLS